MMIFKRLYFDYGYDDETDKQLSDNEVEKIPQACERILEINRRAFVTFPERTP